MHTTTSMKFHNIKQVQQFKHSVGKSKL